MTQSRVRAWDGDASTSVSTFVYLEPIGGDGYVPGLLLQDALGTIFSSGATFLVADAYCNCELTLPGSGLDCSGNCVEDDEGPLVQAQDIALDLEEDGTATLDADAVLAEPVSDPCSDMVSVQLLTTSFDCTDVGNVIPVTLEAEDESGNISYAIALVTVTDGHGYCVDTSVEGCTYMEAMNYEAEATVDDGSCEFESVEPNDCADLTGDDLVTVDDLLVLLSWFGNACD